MKNSLTAVEKPSRSRFGDQTFQGLTLVMGLAVILLLVMVTWQLVAGSRLALQKFGWHFLTSSHWDPVQERFGAVPFIFGTVISSVIALMVAVPLGLGTAIYMTEYAPNWLRQPVSTVVEMLAAVPSVIFGLWAIFVLVPWLRMHFYPALQEALGFLPLFRGPIYGVGLLSAGIVLAIMILPVITSISREILLAVPDLQREGAYALGATRWEVIRLAVLRYARQGLFGAAVLGLGRALGETMAVTMVIGNRPEIAASLFAPGYTLASVIANEFTEATTDLYLAALFEIGLVLLGVTLVTNTLARILILAFGPAQELSR